MAQQYFKDKYQKYIMREDENDFAMDFILYLINLRFNFYYYFFINYLKISQF